MILLNLRKWLYSEVGWVGHCKTIGKSWVASWGRVLWNTKHLGEKENNERGRRKKWRAQEKTKNKKEVDSNVSVIYHP